ncbi:MAG: hypothetical protein AB7U73_08560 [Pirellulales bacterium]
MSTRILKQRANDAQYFAVLRQMTPADRLRKAIELGELSRKLLRAGLRERFPDLPDDALHRLYLKQLAACHNRNY